MATRERFQRSAGTVMPRGRRLSIYLPSLLTFTCAIAGCATSTSGKIIRMVNDTRATVTVKSCFATTQAPRCSAASRVTPKSWASFPLVHYVRGSVAKLMVITGYGSKPRCFYIPPSSGHVTYVIAYVTDARSGNCIGPYGGP